MIQHEKFPIKKSPIIGIDCMGSDGAPRIESEAVKLLINSPQINDIQLVLFGDQDAIEMILGKVHENVKIINTKKYVKQVDSAKNNDPETSLYQMLLYCHNGEIDACISAANTGAYILLAKDICGTIDGISRMALAALLQCPNNKYKVMLDLGANLNYTAEHLRDFAIMGSAAYSSITDNNSAKVGLLNMGTENHKGTDITQEAHKLLKSTKIQYIGFVEGNNIASDFCDVIVTDAVTGNAAIKLAKGLLSLVKGRLIDKIKETFWLKLILGLIQKPITKIAKDSDPASCAIILGCNNLLTKSHGSTSIESFANSILYTAELVRKSFIYRLLEQLKKL